MSIKKLNRIAERISKIKEELGQTGEMRPGTLSRQYKSPQNKAGAYWQLSYTRKMKSRTEYVRPASVSEIRRQIAAYKRFKILGHRIFKTQDAAIRGQRQEIELGTLKLGSTISKLAWTARAAGETMSSLRG